MMHLREIVGDTSEQMPQPSERVIKLDEQIVTQEELNKRMQDDTLKRKNNKCPVMLSSSIFSSHYQLHTKNFNKKKSNSKKSCKFAF